MVRHKLLIQRELFFICEFSIVFFSKLTKACDNHVYSSFIQQCNWATRLYIESLRDSAKSQNIIPQIRNEHHAPEDVLPAVEKGLKDLGLDYLDLYLIHSPATLKKGVSFPTIAEEFKLGYDPEIIAKTWVVS